MMVLPGTTFDLIRRLSLDSKQATRFIEGFMPLLPDKLDENHRGLLREGLHKLLQNGVKEPMNQMQYGPLLDMLTYINPEQLRIKYGTQRGVSQDVQKDMRLISQRWENLTRRAKAAHALLQYMRAHHINGAELARRLDVSRSYLVFLLGLRRSITGAELAERIASLTGLSPDEFKSPHRGGFSSSRPSRDEVARLLERRRIRQIVKDMQHLSDSQLDTIGQVVRSLAEKRM